MLLSTCANQVLQEFGGAMPEVLVSFEDASREFISVRALELQKLGVSTTDVTVTKSTLNASSREGTVPATTGVGMIPAFVELTLNDSGVPDARLKVEIIPTELIPSYEGSRAIAFYGTPMKYRLSWDVWDEGTITLWHDPIEDLTQFTSNSDVTFPPNFITYLFKKTALNLIRTAVLKLALVDPASLRQSQANIGTALSNFQGSLAAQCSEWEVEFRKWRNLDLNSQRHLRRTQDELALSDFDNVTGSSPLDYIG
jgi:hypothetical protein